MWMKNIDTQDQEQGDVARYCVMKEYRQVGGGVDVGGCFFYSSLYLMKKCNIYIYASIAKSKRS